MSDEPELEFPVGKAGETVAYGGRRCSLACCDNLDGWYVGISPRNGYGAIVEGPWEDWVQLAREILKREEERTAASASAEGK